MSMSIFDIVSETKLWRDYEIFIKCYSSLVMITANLYIPEVNADISYNDQYEL
jgi:hypothetical protein